MRNRKLNCSFVQDNNASGGDTFTRQDFFSVLKPGGMQVLSELPFLEQLRQREELHESQERVGYRESKKKEVSKARRD